MVKRWNLVICVIILTFLISIISVSNIGQAADQHLILHEVHDSIEISSNIEFTSENGVRSGSGTESDPYIISNWTITYDGISLTTTGIHIASTTAYCIIQDCIISEFRHDSFDSPGIRLNNAQNIIIQNCTVFENDLGILLDETHQDVVTNCTLYNNGNVLGEGGGGETTSILISVITFLKN